MLVLTRIVYGLLATTTLTLLAACGQQGVAASATATAASQPAADTVSAAVYSLNYSHEHFLQYTVYDATADKQPAIGGANVYPLGGGDQGCCIALPKQWHPGLKVIVQWSYGDSQRILESDLRQEMVLPEYSEPGDLYVVFHGGKDVELVVSRYGPGHPQWPGRIKQEPMAHCMATEANQKLCSRWTVKNMTWSPADNVASCKGQPADEQCQRLKRYCLEAGGDEEECSID